MNTFLFNPDYIAKYYNCSGRTYEEWKALGKPNIFLGIVYAVLGSIFMVLLLPFMAVFIKSDLMKYSCYKIMFLLAIIDCIQIPIAGFYCGYAMIIGMVYCMAPKANYIFGGLALTSWCSGSMTCMLLAINRSIDVMNPQLGQQLFSGKKTIIWLMIPVVYFFYCFFFQIPPLFNSGIVAFIFDPFIGTPERNGTIDNKHYPHMITTIHNIVVPVVLLIAYSCLIIRFTISARKSADRIRINKIQRQIFLQCTLVCIMTFIAALIYTYIQFLPAPIWVVACAEVAWQFSHGAAGISYAFLNPTMRNELIKILRFNSKPASTTETGNVNEARGFTNNHQSMLGY